MRAKPGWTWRIAEPAILHSGGAGALEQQADADPGGDERCRFRIFQTDRVSLTSTRCEGGDWHWQFCSPQGEILAECPGYQSEAQCRAAILRLQNEAAYARLSGPR